MTKLSNIHDDDDAQQPQFEVMGPSALESTERAMVVAQMEFAQKYPRRIGAFLAQVEKFVTSSVPVAESCIYVVNVGGNNNAEGASIRFAETLAAAYGHLNYGSQIIEQTDRYVTAMGACIDLQTNTRFVCQVKETTLDKNGRPYSERQRNKIAGVAQAKAQRNAILKVIPRTLWQGCLDKAYDIIHGDAETLEQRRARVVQWVDRLRINNGRARMLAALGITAIEEIGRPEIERLAGMKTAINDGEIEVEDAFPVIVVSADVPETKPATTTAAEKPAKPAAASKTTTAAAKASPAADATETEDMPPNKRFLAWCQRDGLEPGEVLAYVDREYGDGQLGSLENINEALGQVLVKSYEAIKRELTTTTK